MAKQRYELEAGERLLLKGSSICHSLFAPYTDELVLTNKRLIWVNLGLFGNHKQTVAWPLSEINQAIAGKAQNGSGQLEVYTANGVEIFMFQSDSKRQARTWAMAIMDRFSPEGEFYDYDYYKGLADGTLDISDYADGSPGSLKQELKDTIMDELGFTDIGNEFREMFGLKPKLTQSKKKEILQKQEYERRVTEARQNATARMAMSQAVGGAGSKMTVNEQMDALKKMKELLDAGILTQEEFDKKKQEIMNQ